MSHIPLVSICMPSYNHAGSVGFTIESMLAQTFADFELLINDDRSSDLTFDVIRSYDDPRINAVRQEHRSGPSVTANASIRRARGKYLAFCASDDLWLPDKLEQQVRYMEANPGVGAIFCRPWLIDSDGNRLPDDAHLLGLDFGGEKLDRKGWLARMFWRGNCLCAITPLLRADAVRHTGAFDPLLLQLQDFDFWVRFLMHHELRLLPQRVAEYRVNTRGSNLSAKSFESVARLVYEGYHVLCHYGHGDAADAVAAMPLRGEPLFTWQPQAPSRELLVAERALQRANMAPHSLAHFLFALDCLHAYGASENRLKGAPGEERLFSLPLYEVTGSSLAQDLFLGHQKAMSLERRVMELQSELDALRSADGALPPLAGSNPAGSNPAGSNPAGLWQTRWQTLRQTLRRAFGIAERK